MNSSRIDHEGYLTRSQAAQLLSVSNRTINRWIDKGLIKAWKTAGGQSRIYPGSIEAILKEREPQQLSSDRRTVLVVEDDPEIREFICLYLESLQLPINVLQAGNGFEGLMLIGQAEPELVLTDLMMPGLDGLEMIRCLRENPIREDINIVSITMLDDDEIQDMGGLPEDVRVLHKPVQVAELRELIQSWFYSQMTTHDQPLINP